jgi:predicted DNA-binding protein
LSNNKSKGVVIMAAVEKVRFQITVPKNVAERLTRLSKEKAVPKSAIIALALEEYEMQQKKKGGKL